MSNESLLRNKNCYVAYRLTIKKTSTRNTSILYFLHLPFILYILKEHLHHEKYAFDLTKLSDFLFQFQNWPLFCFIFKICKDFSLKIKLYCIIIHILLFHQSCINYLKLVRHCNSKACKVFYIIWYKKSYSFFFFLNFTNHNLNLSLIVVFSFIFKPIFV